MGWDAVEFRREVLLPELFETPCDKSSSASVRTQDIVNSLGSAEIRLIQPNEA